jgi:hypothetical protein
MIQSQSNQGNTILRVLRCYLSLHLDFLTSLSHLLFLHSEWSHQASRVA